MKKRNARRGKLSAKSVGKLGILPDSVRVKKIKRTLHRSSNPKDRAIVAEVNTLQETAQSVGNRKLKHRWRLEQWMIRDR